MQTYTTLKKSIANTAENSLSPEYTTHCYARTNNSLLDTH